MLSWDEIEDNPDFCPAYVGFHSFHRQKKHELLFSRGSGPVVTF